MSKKLLVLAAVIAIVLMGAAQREAAAAAPDFSKMSVTCVVPYDAGGLFIISPDTNTDVIKRTRELGLVSMPGALTPSEIMTAHRAGADFVKLFPAADMGPGYLKAVRAPLNHIKLMAVGGINEKNAGDFLAAGAAGVGVGGNLANRAWIEAGEFGKITAAASALVSAVAAFKK